MGEKLSQVGRESVTTCYLANSSRFQWMLLQDFVGRFADAIASLHALEEYAIATGLIAAFH
jgi:hypothetical protein